MRSIAGFTAALLLTLSVGLAGCSLMPHALQPQQLWKLNRQPPASGDAYFSIPPGESTRHAKITPITSPNIASE